MRPPTGAARCSGHEQLGSAAAPRDHKRGARAHPAHKHTQKEARRHKAWACASRRELLSMANLEAGLYERRRGRPPVRRSAGRVVSALFFFPRGGSAQVARALCRALPAIGWEVSLAAGSLGSAGEQGHAPSFFAGVDVDFPSRTTARARRSGDSSARDALGGSRRRKGRTLKMRANGHRRGSRTHTVEPLEDPVPRELPDESPEREEPAEPPREPGEGTGVRRRPHGSAGLRRADRRLARLVRRRSRGRPSALLDRLPHALAAAAGARRELPQPASTG
jgi:hypothetical protein